MAVSHRQSCAHSLSTTRVGMASLRLLPYTQHLVVITIVTPVIVAANQYDNSECVGR